MQEWAVAAARSACHGCRTPGHSHRPRQGPLGRAECTLRARTVSAAKQIFSKWAQHDGTGVVHLFSL